MKVYFIYATIPREVYDEKIKFLLGHEYDFRVKKDKMYGLYAFTKSKKLLNDFLYVRNKKNLYTVIKAEVDEYDYEHYRDERSNLKLQRSSFETLEGETMEIVVTKNEEYIIKYDKEEYMHEFGFKPYRDLNYVIFNKKLQNSLDKLGYVKLYDTFYGNEEDLGYVGYQESFNLTPLGNDIIPLYSEVNVLLYLFRFMFMGEETLKVGDDN